MQDGVVCSDVVYVAVGAATRTGIAGHTANTTIESFLSQWIRGRWASGHAGGIVYDIRIEECIVGVGEDGAS